MARQRSYSQDVESKAVDGPTLHKASGRYYSIEKDGQRKYRCLKKDTAIKRYRASPKLRLRQQTTAEGSTQELSRVGFRDDDISHESMRVANRNRFVFSNY